MKKYLDETLSPQERAEALTDEMTVEEMASQLRFESPAIPRLGIPAYNWWNEGLHGLARSGTATMFPQAIGMAATFDRETLKEESETVSVETRVKYREYSARGDYGIYKGLTLWSPNINIFRDPRWGRGHETFGEDPYLTAELGKVFVRGIQGDGKTMRAAACAKHFAVHSGPEALRHEFDAVVSPKDLEETYLPAFEALVKEAKVEGVMGAYNRVLGEPACASELLMGKLKEWGFDGYFTSDCGAISDFHTYHKVTSSPEESVTLALNKGCDVNCGCMYEHVFEAYSKGMLSEDAIKRACVHLMRTRFRLGMFDKKTEYDDIPYSVVSCDEHKQKSLEAALRSMVLLKNDGILPIDEKKYGSIAVIGPESDSRSVLMGNYHGTADEYVTFLEGIRKHYGGRVYYSEGCHLRKDNLSDCAEADDRISEALVCADNADLVVLCVGLDETIEGEEGCVTGKFKGDKGDLLLPGSQRRLIEAVMKTGKPVVVVLSTGSSVDPLCTPNALIESWYPGQEGGTALAKILFGDVSPSGKLPVTFYSDYKEDFSDYSMKNKTYRYVEGEENVLYPFGYGLTYSDVRCLSVAYSDGCAAVTVKNEGGRATEDVVQLYIKDHGPHGVRNHSLCGFERVALEAGEEKVVKIPVPQKAFTSVDESGKRAVFGDRFTLYAGTSQPDALSEKLTGHGCPFVEINF